MILLNSSIQKKWKVKHKKETWYYHSVACLMLELGRNVLFPGMLGLNSPTVTTPIIPQNLANFDTSAPH